MSMELFLSALPPFSLPAVVRSHGWIRLAPFREAEAGGGLEYVTRLDDSRVVSLRVHEAAGGVRVTADEPLGTAEQAEIAGQVRWMLGLDEDLSAFYAAAQAEPKLAHVAEKAQGRLLRSPTLFEDMVKTILTTNTSWGGTLRMVDALVSQCGTPLPADPARRAFPGPEQVAGLDEQALRETARLGYRAPYVLELAQAAAAGDVAPESFKDKEVPTAKLRKQLLAIQGIGDYAAANLLMLLGRYDFIPVDSWARMLVSREWYGGEPVGKSEVEAAFARWEEWKGLAYWFWDWQEGVA